MLLDCCGTLTPEAQPQCQAGYDMYHDHDDADRLCQQALDALPASCMSPTTPTVTALFTIDDYLDSERSAGITFHNTTAGPLPVFQELFELELADGTLRTGDSTFYEGECRQQIAAGATIQCRVRFYDAALRERTGVRITYRFGTYTAVQDIPASMQNTGFEENTYETCTDGYSNDRDRFVDCDDSDCCAVVPSCGADTFCGRQGCTTGPEDTLDACTDGCNNDGDTSWWIDCDDSDCCAVLSQAGAFCDSATYCGR